MEQPPSPSLHSGASLSRETPALPSQWELASLAAIIGGKETTPGNACEFVASALAVWKQAGELLASESETTEARRQREAVDAIFSERNMLKGPLKIGNQLLPRVEAFAEDRACLDDFTHQAVGLRKAEDRMPWLKGFIKALLLRERRQGPDYKRTAKLLPIESVAKVTTKEVEKAMEAWRRDGIQEAMDLLERYRRWRLTMEKPNQPRPEKAGPHNLEACFYAARKDAGGGASNS